MKETVPSEFARARIVAPPGATARQAFVDRLAARSAIVWGEHCSECDYPRCYSSCAFYDPRPDLHCRRFLAGIEQADDGLMRIRFRQWGKLEGKGPTVLRPMRLVAQREARDAQVGRMLAVMPAPYAVKLSLGRRWNERKLQVLDEPAAERPDAFVVEGWSNNGGTHGFTLTFLQEGPHGAVFQAPFQLGPEYGRLEVPVAAIAGRIDLALPYLVQIEPVGEAEGIDAVFGLADFVTYAANPAALPDPAPATAPLAKVLIWDLDETLWTGTLAEDGAEGVTPRPEAVAAIQALDARGVLMSIASKNEEAEALAALRRFGLDEYFLHPQVNWGPKSQSVARIAQALDLGIDSFVFIDDQPFERAEVQAGHAAVRVLTHQQVGELLSHPWFNHPITPESGQRRALYRAEADRSRVFEAAGGDYAAFLRSSELTLQIADLTPGDAERTHELSQRTNQLNFTGAKLSRDEVQAMLAHDADTRRLVLRCRDRFGDYGLIGFAELDLREGVLRQFFMSCRVQRKRVEHAAFQHFAELLRSRGAGAMQVDFRSTARNGAAVRMLEELGFTQTPAGWTRVLAEDFPEHDVVRVSTVELEAA